MSLVRKRYWLLTHKWIGIGVGGILAIWILSGLGMRLPQLRAPGPPRMVVPFENLVVRPAEAATRAETRRGTAASRVDLVPLGDALVWSVQFPTADPVLIDAMAGTIIEVTPLMAERLARTGLPPSTPLEQTERLTSHRIGYSRGALPVYRFRFGDARSTVVIVDPRTGGVRWTTSRSRLHEVLAAIHSFRPLRLLPGGDLTQTIAIWFASLLILLGLLTGFYIGFPRWRRGPKAIA